MAYEAEILTYDDLNITHHLAVMCNDSDHYSTRH